MCQKSQDAPEQIEWAQRSSVHFWAKMVDPMNKLGTEATIYAMHRSVDRTILAGKSIVLFRAAIKSPQTLDPYERRLCNFLDYTKMNCDQFVTLAKKNPAKAEKILIEYAVKDRDKLYEKDPQKKLAACTIVNRLKPVKLLLDINDVEKVKWKKIKRFLPTPRRFANDRAPTIEEIRKIYNVCDLRGKAMLLLMLSSGIREGALEGLSIRHLTPIERDGKIVAARLVVYPGEPEEYVAFATPEAYFAIQEYLSYRQKAGERIGPESPLIRDKFEPETRRKRLLGEQVGISQPKRCTPLLVRHYFNRLFVDYGFRTEKRKRHEFSIHGFRKWFKTRAEQKMRPINVELLMGHSVGLSDSYYRPTENDFLEDYLKAVPHLTVSEVEEVRTQMSGREKALEQKLAEMEQRLTALLPLALAAAQGSLIQAVPHQART